MLPEYSLEKIALLDLKKKCMICCPFFLKWFCLFRKVVCSFDVKYLYGVWYNNVLVHIDLEGSICMGQVLDLNLGIIK